MYLHYGLCWGCSSEQNRSGVLASMEPTFQSKKQTKIKLTSKMDMSRDMCYKGK